MGLVNRVVPTGRRSPQRSGWPASLPLSRRAALRSDRLSAYEQWGQPLPDALQAEYRYGAAAIGTGEMAGGLERFAEGAWRAGPRPEDPG